MRWTQVMLLGAVVAAASLSMGCVGKKLFRQTSEQTDTRVEGAESAIEANERRIADMRDETDDKIREMGSDVERATEMGRDAMSTAQSAQEQAERAALGKLLWSVTLSDESVKFSFGEGAMPDSARTALDELADRIKSYGKAVYVEIEGHTDSIGAEDYNYSLGEARAKAVRDYLGAQGNIPLHAMNTISYGESKPVADNTTPAGRSANRRVVIRVLE